MFDNQTSFRGNLVRELITKMTSNRLIGKKIQRGEHLTKITEPKWNCPKGYDHQVVQRDQYLLEILANQNPSRPLGILQLHGGGYIGKLRNVHRNMAKMYCDLSRGVCVVSPDYRVAPEHPYPAALEDALSSYEWLLEKGYKAQQILLVGDSAGGGLAMALCLYLKAHGRPLPFGVIAMSPWTDMTASGKSYEINFEKDPLFGKTTDSVLFNRDYVGDENEEKPYISPVFGDFHGFPPMLIQTGSYEMLLSDSIAVAKKAKAAGVEVDLQVYEGMFHDFQMAGELIPESKLAWEEVEKFIESLWDSLKME